MTALPPTERPARSDVLAAIVDALEASVGMLKASSESAHNEATNEDTKQESKYDTRAIEAAYLAGAQSKRMMATGVDLKRYRGVSLEGNGSGRVDEPSVVGLEHEETGITYYFVGPGAAGLKVDVGPHRVLVITPSSPLGKALVGCAEDDETKFGTVLTVE
ncbi:MAG: transcription elongation GreA/GreB family factor [Bradymonadia bacterium]|jgi:transcription elongation GreA/GreB family factor